MAGKGELIQQSIQFSINLIDYYKWLRQEKQELVLSHQILKSGTSIGANIHEANFASSKSDFISKMQISLKEASETEYWFLILDATGYLPVEYFHLKNRCESLKRMLIKTLNTAKKE